MQSTYEFIEELDDNMQDHNLDVDDLVALNDMLEEDGTETQEVEVETGLPNS